MFTAFVLFYNLDGRLLWNDEAETALLAGNVIKYGLPKVVVDGKNLIAYTATSADSNEKQVWIWSPWLKEYVAAASFSLLGKSTAAARLPFAVAGFLGVVLFARLVFTMYGSHETAIIAMLFFISSELFILHVRQCRYYSTVIFAEVWLILGLYHLFNARYRRGALHMAMALAVQFYCNYIIVIGNVLAIALTALIANEHNRRLSWRYIASGLAAFTLMAAPWILYARPWVQKGFIYMNFYFNNLRFYAVEVNFHLFPYILLLIPAGYKAFKWGTGGKRLFPADNTPRQSAVEFFLWILIPLQLIIFSLAPGQFLRYVTSLIPVVSAIQALLIMRYIKAALVRYVLAGLICLTNFLPVYGLYLLNYGHKPAFPIINLVRSIAAPYSDRMEDVIRFLKKEAAPNESILVFDTEFPLMFYTGMQIIDGRLHSEKPIQKPDWIFLKCVSCMFDIEPMELPASILNGYNRIEIEVHNTKTGGMIPDPDRYEYFSAEDKETFAIYKRKPDAPR
ncbi:MAG: glycosyltransferase family 39 protein [Nitrospirae bacterium]|nr:glycosyltransferase family 39 protein [Nitrospirota bacterium]